MTRHHLKGLAATVGLLGIVGGVPVLLYGLGGGLPAGVPDAHQAASFLGRPLGDSDVLRGLSLVCWAVWALFVFALGAEAVAWSQQRPGPSLTRTGFRIPGLQGAAGSLFLTAVLLLPNRPAGTGLPPSRVVASPVPVAAATSSPAFAAADPVDLGLVATADGRIPYVVQHGETLWGIAESHVGNGLAWRQITDAAGRSFDTGMDEWVQVNGRMIYEREARLIFPGETVYLPASWAPASARPATDSVKDPPPAQPQPTAAYASVAPSNPGPALTAEPSTTTQPSISIPGGQATNSNGQSHGESPIQIVGLVGAGMLAGAVLSTLNRMRARQGSCRRPGRRIRLPDTGLQPAEFELRNVGRGDLIRSTQKALHALAAELRRQGPEAPTICAVAIHDDKVEVLLDRPGTPPQPWQASEDCARWSIARDRIPAEPANGVEPLPCLVPVGREQGSNAEILVNLAAAGLLNLRGDADRSAALLHVAALSLAGLPWAASADVVLIGGDEDLAGGAVQVRAACSLDEVIDQLEDKAVGLRETFGETVSTGVDRPEGWLPTVLLMIQQASDDALARLVSLCTTGSGIYAMVTAPIETPGWTLDVDHTPAVIPQLGLALEPLCPSPEQRDQTRRLVALAADTADVGVDDPPYDRLDSGEKDDAPHTPDVTERVIEATRPPDAEPHPRPARINVLGPVTFEDVDNFLRPRSFEIALYLALHPDGVTESRLDEMIWPNKTEVRPSTRDQAVSAARTALGGRSRFPLAHGQGRDKTYRLSDQVTTDWSDFCSLYRQGRRNRDVEPLRAALELVRGRPFGDLDAGPGFQWLHTEGHIHHMEAEIADAADMAAGIYLDEGQPLQARWAARQGLLAGPYTERLWVRLMAAADALGEAQEIERLLAEMDTRLGLDGDFEQLHPETIAAYRLYSRLRASRS